MSQALLRIDKLGVRYAGGVGRALTEVSMDVALGERLAIVGESGSGKSTLALALAGLLPHGAEVSGSIAWPSASRPLQLGRDIGVVFQDPGSNLNPVLRIGEQIAEVSRRHLDHSWTTAYAHTEALVAQVKLPDPPRILRTYPHQLSGGQRQRVAIAEAIAAEPSLLIADEVTSALDTIVQAQIVALLGELVRRGSMTLIFVTHDIALAAGFADRIAVFNRGELVEIGPARDIAERPSAAYTRELLANHIGLDRQRLVETTAP